jgi:outer membrane protein TolC
MQAHVAGMRARAIDATAERRIARAELNRLMNRPLETDIVLASPLPAAGTSGTPPDAGRPIVDQHPEVEQAALRVDLANVARVRARDAFLPEIAVQGGYEWNDGARGGPASAWVMGAAVRVNLFSGGAARARMKEAGFAAERARAEQQRAMAAAEVELVTAVEQLAAARARETVGRAAAAQARESQRIIRDRFEAGLAPASDVIRAATAVLDAEALRVRAFVDVTVGEAAVRRARGNGGTQP